MRLRLVGDIHGDINPIQVATRRGYERVLHGDYGLVPDLVVQLGDFGFRDTYRNLHRWSPDRLKILGGNHDDYPDLVNHPHYLGDFGILPGTTDVFFVRGALSIDRHLRVEGRDWWPEEQLGYHEQNAAVELYEATKPRIVLSHDCPYVVNHMMYGDRIIYSATSNMLQEMLNRHEPEQWFFGHHHHKWQKQLGPTRFRCVDIDEIVDVEV